MNDEKSRLPAESARYDADYYHSHCGATPYSRDEKALMNHFRNFAATLVDRYAPTRVLDVGCAKGLLVEHLRDLGVDARGIDTSEYALSEVRQDMKPYCTYGSGLEPLDGQYDFITCIEVAEHLDESQAEALIANLCAHADDIVFSSTPLDFAEATHFNVQPTEYWQTLFARNGFFPDLRFEPHFVTPHAMRFKKMTRPLNVVIFSKEKAEWAVVRLRILDPLRELEKHGRMNVTYVSAYDTKLPIEKLLAADVFVIQREFAEKATSARFLEVAKTLGKIVVFEIDDLLTKTPRSNPVYPYSMRVAGDLIDCARNADFVTTSTQPLLDELREEAVIPENTGFVLRNCVNTEIWGGDYTPRLPAAGQPYVVGWFGSPTHDEDLAIVKDAIGYLARKHQGEIEFHFFGYLPKELAEIPGVKLVRGSQPNVVKHAAGVREARIDLAIAPLVDNAFNRSKSDLKWLEYSICGIPAVFSDVAPYREALTHGVNGWVVKNDTASWVAAIEHLLRNDELRLTLARNAFETVRNHYCLDVAVDRWDSLYRAFVVSGPRVRADAEADDAAARRAIAVLLVAQARFQMNRGKHDDAATSLDSALQFDAECGADALPLAVALANHGHDSAAIRTLSTIATRCVNQDVVASAWLNLARVHRALGNLLALDAVLDAGAAAAPADPDLALEHLDRLRWTGRDAEIGKRLEKLAEGDYRASQALVLAEALIAAGRTKEALLICRRAGARFPDADFAPLIISLQRAATIPEHSIGQWSPARHRRKDVMLKVAVFTRENMAGPRLRTRLVAPLSVLESAAGIAADWSNGQSRIDIADSADIVIFQRSIIGWEGFEKLFEYARRRNKKIAYEIDDVFFAGAESALAVWLPRFDAVFVPTRALESLLLSIAPTAAGKIQVIPTGLDIELGGVRPVRSPQRKKKPHLALFTGYAKPNDLRAIVSAIGAQLEERIGKFALSHWDALPSDSATSDRRPAGGCASPIYAEFARRLVSQGVDLALVPVSDDPRHAALSDRLWLDLSAARVPGLYSVREPFASSVLAGSTGFLLTDDPNAWVAGAANLIENPLLRKDVADRAFTVVQAERTIPQLAKKLGRALHDLARNTPEPARANTPTFSRY